MLLSHKRKCNAISAGNKRNEERTGDVDVLDDVEDVVLVDLPLLLSLQDVINGALEPTVVVHGLGAHQLPAHTHKQARTRRLTISAIYHAIPMISHGWSFAFSQMAQLIMDS